MNAKMWLVVALSLGVVGNAQAMSSDYIEQALISTCKSIASDRVGNMKRTLREHRLTVPLIGEKLLCNGMHVVAFAESRGAERTAGYLEQRVGRVEIIDIATNWSVQVD